MIALSMVLRSHPMSLGGVFMMLSCLVMRVLCLGIDISTLLNPLQVMNHASSHPAQAGVDYSSASRQLPRARVIIYGHVAQYGRRSLPEECSTSAQWPELTAFF